MRQAFQHYGVEDMRLNFVDVYPSDCGIHDGAPQQTNVDGWKIHIVINIQVQKYSKAATATKKVIAKEQTKSKQK